MYSVWNIETLYVSQSILLHFFTLCCSHIRVLTSQQTHFWIAIAQRINESQNLYRYVFLWMTIFATNQQQRVKTDDGCKSQLQFASTALNIYCEFLGRSIFATNWAEVWWIERKRGENSLLCSPKNDWLFLHPFL